MGPNADKSFALSTEQALAPDLASDLDDAAELQRAKRVRVERRAKIFVPVTGYEADCSLINLSPNGAEIAADISKLPDAPIVVYADGFGRLEGKIVWRGDGRCGIEFSGTKLKKDRISGQLSGYEAAPHKDRWTHRKHKREATNATIRFVREDGSVETCKVLNMSVGGALLETSIRPPLREFILIAGTVGRVVRHHETGFAVQFVIGRSDETSEAKVQEILDKWAIDEASN